MRASPSSAGGRLLGTIAFATRRRTHFGADALNLIRTVSDLVAAALAREVLEEELRASEGRFRAVFDNAGIGLGQASVDRGYFESNDAFCRIIGYSQEELAARHWTDYTHPDDVAIDLALDGRMRAGEIPSYTLEKRYIHKDGQVVWARLSLSAVRDGQGQLTHEIAMVEDISERKAAEAALRSAMEAALEAARTDSLTGLPNRTAFNEALTKPARAGERAIVFIDVDGFKRINDSLGHGIGDDLIRRLAARLNVFAGPDCFLARIGGDEFVFVVTGPNVGERTRELSEGVSRAARSPLHLTCCPVQIRLAVGYAVQSDDLMDAETLLRHADLAMYEAKGRRTGEPVAFDALLERSTFEAKRIERELRRALGRSGEIFLAYQPIVGPDGRLSHAEALARWTSPVLGEVPPDRFIAVAERSGLMVELGSKLFALICKDLVRVPNLRVSVNVSSIQLMAPNFLQSVLEEVLARGLDPARIEIELTESVLVEDASLAEQRIAEMRKAGFSVALDDFGTGFSSMGYLHRMSFDRLKIDRSFVTGFSGQPKRIALLSSLIVMAHAMDLRVVAEGVETAQDARTLQAFGCDFLQGFWVRRPGTLEEIAVAWLATPDRRAALHMPAKDDPH
jgi:diguanylate cyclase (GGDEF)-like protein/PAS domain S-box-containing protein